MHRRTADMCPNCLVLVAEPRHLLVVEEEFGHHQDWAMLLLATISLVLQGHVQHKHLVLGPRRRLR